MADPTDPLPDVLSDGGNPPTSGAQAELLVGTEGPPFSTRSVGDASRSDGPSQSSG